MSDTFRGSGAAAPAGIPPDALAAWPEIDRRLGRRRLAVFLDYDGTLTPIVERPDRARLGDDMKAALRACARRWPTVIVSGRGREDVAALVGLDRLIYAGSHGFDVAGPPGSPLRLEVASDVVPLMAALVADVRERTRDIPGVLVEDKRFSVAVHYRLVAADRIADLQALVDATAARHPGVTRADGKKVFELRPAAEWDKGRAVQWLLEALDLTGPGIVPVFIGDDLTDEDAFRAIGPSGLAVVVMDEARPTAAHYSVRTVDDVRLVLDRLTHRTADDDTSAPAIATSEPASSA